MLMEKFTPSPNRSDNRGKEPHRRAGKEPMGETFAFPVVPLEVVHLSESDSSRNALDVIRMWV